MYEATYGLLRNNTIHTEYLRTSMIHTDICTTSYMLHLGTDMIDTCLVHHYFLVASCFGFDTYAM